MHKRCLVFAIVLLLVSMASAKDVPKFKSIEVKHFTLNEGVELPPEFKDYLYAELRAALQKKKLAEQLVGEDEVVDPADVAQSLIIEGNVVEYKKGNAVKEGIVTLAVGASFGAGARSLTTHVKVVRRNDNQAIIDKDLKVKVPARAKPEWLARFLAKEITGEVKKEAHGSAGASAGSGK